MDIRPLLLASAAALALVACGRGDESRETVAPPQQASSASERSGEQVYTALCKQCHEGQVLKAPHLTMLGLMSPRGILAALETGIMREQALALTPTERQRVAEFLAGRALEEPVSVAPAMICDAKHAAFDFDAPPDVAGWGVDLRNSHFLPGSVAGLTADDLPALKLKWAFAFPDAIRVRSKPVIGGGALFVGSQDGTVYALDRLSGCVRWTFVASSEVRTGILIDGWRAGDRNARPALYFGDLTGNVYAVDAISGQLIWRDRPDEHPSATITASPVRFEDRLYVPLSSLEVTAAASPAYPCCNFRGGVAAYDAASGRRLWIARTIDEIPHQVSVNVSGTPQFAPSGAPIWGSPALDSKRRRLYVGTGENYSSPANDRSDAIIAFNLDTGEVVWSWQATSGDAWNMGCEAADRTNCPVEDGPDFDFGAAPVLATTRDGRDVVLAGQKSGSVHALDAETGELIWQRKLGRGGIQGGVHFGMSTEDELVFVPICDFYGGPRWPGEARPGLYALDIASGEQRWEWKAEDVCQGRDNCDPGISAAIAGLPGIVFAGSMDGWVRAHDSATGAVLWQFDTAREFTALDGKTARGGSVGGGAAPAFKDGMLYLSSGYGIYNHMPGNVLLALAIE